MPATVKLTFTDLSGVLDMAVAEKQIKKKPCPEVNLPPVDKAVVMPLTIDQVQQVYDSFVFPYRVLAIVAVDAGLRPSELFGLTWDRVDLDTGVLTVDQQLTGRVLHRVEFGQLRTVWSYPSASVGPKTLQYLRQQAESNSERLVFRIGEIR